MMITGDLNASLLNVTFYLTPDFINYSPSLLCDTWTLYSPSVVCERQPKSSLEADIYITVCIKIFFTIMKLDAGMMSHASPFGNWD